MKLLHIRSLGMLMQNNIGTFSTYLVARVIFKKDVDTVSVVHI